jgi:hypothetical protein
LTVADVQEDVRSEMQATSLKPSDDKGVDRDGLALRVSNGIVEKHRTYPSKTRRGEDTE